LITNQKTPVRKIHVSKCQQISLFQALLVGSSTAAFAASNGLLTFINGGSIPLGSWGTNVQVTLIVADTLGNTGTNISNFTLEVQPQVVSNIFVFGSPRA
jgi:hypothetical protein